MRGRELHYTEWGAQHAETVIAWHGLARTGRDMDDIAAHLSQRWRVICPDTLGRGLSQWSPAPEQEYCLDFYVKLAARWWMRSASRASTGSAPRWAARSAPGRSHPLRGRIRRLVLNDNGPQLADAAIERIRSYAGSPAAFATVSELEQYFRTIYKPYGWLSDAQWRRLTETSTRRLPDGRVTPHYDPAMVMQFTHHADDYRRWDGGTRWTSRCCACAARLPTCCCRDRRSDAQPRPARRGGRNRRLRPRPALNTPEQFALVERFFAG